MPSAAHRQGRPAAAEFPSPVGTYDGSQSELAAGLDLRADGRFLYLLSYGALDEKATGVWSTSPEGVLLTSDPVRLPRFILLNQQSAAPGRLLVELDALKGLSRQYFYVEIGFADGGTEERQFGDEAGPLVVETTRQVTSITPTLPMFEIRASAIALAGTGGHDLRFRFEPNDLGKVRFSRTLLRNDHGELLLQRHDRMIRFRQLAGSPVSTP